MWSWKERERTRKRGRRRTQILRHNGGDGKNEDKDWEEECVGVNFRWKKKKCRRVCQLNTHTNKHMLTQHIEHHYPIALFATWHKKKTKNTKPTGHKTYKELSWQRHTHPCTDAHTHDLTARPDTPVSSVCNKRRVSFKETNTLHVYVRLCREAGKPEVTPKAIHLIRLPITKRRSRAG